MKKRWLSFAVSLIMLLLLLPFTVYAEEKTENPSFDAAPSAHITAPTPEKKTPPTAPGTILAENPETKELCSVVPYEPKDLSEKEKKIYFNSTNFPDAIFRNLLRESFGRDYMTESEAEWIRSINVTGMGISNLKGIKYFTSLEKLYCGAGYDDDGNVVGKNSLSSLDIRSLSCLKELYCDNNKLKTLDISGMPNLNILVCDDNPMTSLKMRENTLLCELYCGNTHVTSFNFVASETYGLTVLEVINNGLSSLDVSNQSRLRLLYCSGNNLTELNIENCEALERLSCGNNKLKTLDTSKNEHLGEVYCADNQLTSIKFMPWRGMSTLDCSNNKLASLNLRIASFGTLCCDNNLLTDIDVSHMKQIGYVYCDNNRLTHLKLSTTETRVSCRNNLLTEIDSPIPEYMLSLDCTGNRLQSLDLSVNRHLEVLLCGDNEISGLDLSNQTELQLLDCSNNRIEALDLTQNTALLGLACENNRIAKLDLEGCAALEAVYCGSQCRSSGPLTVDGSSASYDVHVLDLDPARVSPADGAAYAYDAATGVLSFDVIPSQFTYLYDTGAGAQMDVTLIAPYYGNATIRLTDPAIAYKGATPYMVHTGSALLPVFEVVGEDGSVVDPMLYRYDYRNNTDPGTATIAVQFPESGKTCSAWFKIYLPPTTATAVENIENGIQVTYAAVPSAKGYVIYRRAWSSTTNGWTEFKRWNNTTETTWIDTKVYAGTRYQYGVKAYFSDPMDNYNLGIVGPLKTTVRITTRVLNSVTPGSGRLTAKWSGSSVFTGYEVQAATDDAFTENVKTVTIDSAKTYQTTVRGLKSNKTYYVRVRSYHLFEGMTYYGQWSNILQTTVK